MTEFELSELTGTLILVAVTFVTMFVTNLISEKHKRNKKHFDKTHKKRYN